MLKSRGGFKSSRIFNIMKNFCSIKLYIYDYPYPRHCSTSRDTLQARSHPDQVSGSILGADITIRY